MGGDTPMSADSFEKHAGKIITALIVAAILGGGAFLLDAKQELALQGQDLSRIAENIWTKQQQETYDARVQARFEAMHERVKRVEQGR
jgi:hypothetical protein